MLGHPAVDFLPSSFRIVQEIGGVQPGSVELGQVIDERRIEWEGLFAPESVGELKRARRIAIIRIGARGAACGQILVGLLKRAGQGRLVERKMQGAGYLGRRVSFGARPGHRQRLGDAIGGNDEIPRSVRPEHRIEVECEGRIAFDQRGRRIILRGHAQSSGEAKHRGQHEQYQTSHHRLLHWGRVSAVRRVRSLDRVGSI